jgi:IS5 family transposase
VGHYNFGAQLQATMDRPALSPRLVAGLIYLKHAYDFSEAVVNICVANP